MAFRLVPSSAASASAGTASFDAHIVNWLLPRKPVGAGGHRLERGGHGRQGNLINPEPGQQPGPGPAADFAPGHAQQPSLQASRVIPVFRSR